MSWTKLFLISFIFSQPVWAMKISGSCVLQDSPRSVYQLKISEVSKGQIEIEDTYLVYDTKKNVAPDVRSKTVVTDDFYIGSDEIEIAYWDYKYSQKNPRRCWILGTKVDLQMVYDGIAQLYCENAPPRESYLCFWNF